ncbi:MAG: thiamine-phosphate kinase [Thermoplasmata archaeon]
MTGRTRSKRHVVRERDFHRWLSRNLPAGRTGLLPIGDDAAALRPLPRHVAVISTDTLVEGSHFLPDSPPEKVGAAAAGVSLSDVAAKGATPDAILLALVLPVGSDQGWAESVLRGAERMGAKFGAHVVGGDTKPGRVRAVISTVLGWGDAAHLAPRTGARPGDLLAVTGDVGRGGLAAFRIRAGGATARRARLEMLEVRPRVREGIALAPFAHSLIDTSDGIADSAHLIARASGVRLVIEEERLPLIRGARTAARSRAALRALAFFGGDYELFAAIARKDWARAEQAVRRSGGRLTPVGRVERGRGAWLESRGIRAPMPAAGWQPFGAASR